MRAAAWPAALAPARRGWIAVLAVAAAGCVTARTAALREGEWGPAGPASLECARGMLEHMNYQVQFLPRRGEVTGSRAYRNAGDPGAVQRIITARVVQDRTLGAALVVRATTRVTGSGDPDPRTRLQRPNAQLAAQNFSDDVAEILQRCTRTS